jgi:hypothetical protein
VRWSNPIGQNTLLIRLGSVQDALQLLKRQKFSTAHNVRFYQYPVAVPSKQPQ